MRVSSGTKASRAKTKRQQFRSAQWKDGELGAHGHVASKPPEPKQGGIRLTVLAFMTALCTFQFTSHIPNQQSGSVIAFFYYLMCM